MGLKEHLFTGCLILLNSFCFCSNYIEDNPRNVSIDYAADDGDLWEGSGYITITCNADCNPPCDRYQFYHNNILNNTSSLKNTRIKKVRESSGRYYCSASNSGGQGYVQSSNIANISIKYPPGNVIIIPDKDIFYTKQHGKPYNDVVCKADCSPPCTYTWYMGYDHTSTLFTTGNTLFATKTFPDYSFILKFYCNASNSLGSSNSIWITVIVKDGPENVTISPSQTPKENSPFSLVCSANCLHGCTSYWWSTGSKRLEENRAVLNFNNLSKADHGDYTCSVGDFFGSKSISYTFSVQSSTDLRSSYNKWTTVKIKDDPRNVSIEYAADDEDLWEGSGYITITCNADCNPPCDSYQIYHNYTLKIRPTSRETRIRKVRENSGQYYCRASNSGLKYVTSINTAFITIKYQTTIMESNLQNVSLRVNDDLPSSVSCRVECNFDYCHSDIDVIKDSQHVRAISSSQSIFENRKAIISDSGTYSCSLGNRKSVRNFTLNILYGPRHTSVTKNNGFMDFENIEEKKDETIPLFCSSYCSPPCGINWYKDGTLLSGETTKSFNMPRHRTMSGNYTCMANGVEGSQTSDPVKILVKYGPENVTITPSQIPKENSPFSLVCSATCLNGCTSYRWSYENKGLDEYKAKLTFNGLSRADNGKYTCSVQDYFGRSSSSFIINVQYSPTNVTVHYLSTYGHLIEKRDNITISCNADCNPACSYQFYRNGQLVNAVYKQLSYWAYRNMSGRYTCSAKTSVANIYKSSNFVDIYIKYEPAIALNFSANQTQITAPGSLNLIFGIDSFPPSNVTVYRKYDKLKTFPNATGQHSFVTSITSCLDEEEYRVEAVNDVGSDSDAMTVNVKCSPIIVHCSNYSDDKGFRIGDLLEFKADFMANPKANVLWTFIPWSSNETRAVEIHKIQNQINSTMFRIQSLKMNDFGTYHLEIRNDIGYEIKKFIVQGPPEAPVALNVNCEGGSAIVEWRTEFSGGTMQTFLINYTTDLTSWETHPVLENVSFFNQSLSTRVNDLRLGQYVFCVQAENKFGLATSSNITVNCTEISPENGDELSLPGRIYVYGAIAGGIFLLLLIIVILILTFRNKNGRKHEDKDNRSRGINETEEGDNGLEMVENIFYISADELDDKIESSNDTSIEKLPNENDAMYSVVRRDFNATDNARPVYSFVKKDYDKAESNTRPVYSFVKKDYDKTESNTRPVYSFVKKDYDKAESNTRPVYSFVKKDYDKADDNTSPIYSFVKKDYSDAEGNASPMYSSVKKDFDKADDNARPM